MPQQLHHSVFCQSLLLSCYNYQTLVSYGRAITIRTGCLKIQFPHYTKNVEEEGYYLRYCSRNLRAVHKVRRSSIQINWQLSLF